MKYSGSDFKFTSQANHMAKLQSMKREYERLGFHLQRLYKRRKADKKGIMRSTFGSIMDPIDYERDNSNIVHTNQCVSMEEVMNKLDTNKDGKVDKANISSEIEIVEF